MEKSNKMTTMVALLLAAVALVVGFVVFSGGDDDADKTSTAANSANSLPIELSLNNLEPLSGGAYEGWIVRDDVKTSFGTFNTDAAGDIVGDLSLEDVTPQNGDTVAISIEPVPDADPEPSATIILAGEIVNGSASLEFPLDTSDFSGSYILATPSNGDDTTETAGLWFVDLPGPTAGLNLPEAPAGWIYEGWAVYEGAPLSTGQFASPAAADSFSGFNGDQMVPPFPGEDFINNLPTGTTTPVDLANGTSVAVISLEPYQNGSDPTGDGPAQIKPLVHMIESGAADHTSFELNYDASSIPSGSASL